MAVLHWKQSWLCDIWYHYYCCTCKK